MKIHKESGVVIWYILAGVALFAALSFTFMRSANQSSGSMSKEQARIASSEILRYGESLKQAVQNLRLVAGCSENDLSFYTSGWATPSDYDNANNLFAGGNFDCFVFQKFGGGQSWSKLNNLTLTGLSEGSYITSAFAIEDIGTAAPDLLLMVRASPEVCTAVNSQAGIGANTDASGVVSTYTAPFIGSYTLVDTLGDVAAHADLAGKTYGCFTDAAGESVIFTVLLDR